LNGESKEVGAEDKADEFEPISLNESRARGSMIQLGYNAEEFEKDKVMNMTNRLDFNTRTDRLIINELLSPWKPTSKENASFGNVDNERKQSKPLINTLVDDQEVFEECIPIQVPLLDNKDKEEI
jgi:hypothetical protein